MSDSILVALIGLAGSGVGSVIGVIASAKLTTYRLEQLEKKVQAHNNLIERMYKVEKKTELIQAHLEEHEKFSEEKFKVANHRIGDLEAEANHG